LGYATITDMSSNPRFDSLVVRMTLNELYARRGFESTREGARYLGVNKDTLDRILTGKTHRHDPPRIQGIAKRLGASDVVAEQLFDLALQTHDNDASGFNQMRKPGNPVASSPFAIVEAAACRLDIYEEALITGLLQTLECMRAYLEVSPFIESVEDSERVIAYKEGRQQTVFEVGVVPAMRVVMSEHALLRLKQLPCYEGQMAHLREMIERYDIGMYVLPISAGPTPAELGAFTLMGFDNPVDFEVAFLEAYAGGAWVEDRDSIAHLRKLFKVILQRCTELGAFLDADKRVDKIQP